VKLGVVKEDSKTSYELTQGGSHLGLEGARVKGAAKAGVLDKPLEEGARGAPTRPGGSGNESKEGKEGQDSLGVQGSQGSHLSLGSHVGHESKPKEAESVGAESALSASASKTFSGSALERLREQLGAEELIIWSSDMTPLATAGGERYQLSPERPSPSQWRQVKSQSVLTVIEGLEDAQAHPEVKPQIKALALMSSSGLQWGLNSMMEPQVLQVTQRLPQALVANALALQAANLEYQERSLAREGLARMYIGTLTLSLFLSVFGAVLLAVLLGNQLARPLLWLVRGVRDVAAGDLSPKPVLTGADELEGLTRSFSQMTTQLLDARQTVEQSLEQVNLARSNLQTILDHLTAGVMVLDRQGLVVSTNPGATRILKIPMAAFIGRSLKSIEGLEVFAAQVLAQFEGFEMERGQGGQDYWQQSFEIQNLEEPGLGASNLQAQDPTLRQYRAFEDFKKKGLTNIVARGASLPNNSWLLVFDDISEIVSAERAQAWGEVARRLAHEIKNPLTPIQLSAERLQMKLSGKLQDAEEVVLNKSVKMIVDQVDAMKRLVNEFRDYARLPQAQLQSLDLNALVSEVVQLYGASLEVPVLEGLDLGVVHAQTMDARGVLIEAILDAKCPPIQADALQLRQVVHNLIQNAQDASEGKPGAGVRLTTHFNSASSRVRLRVEDSGGGFPDFILKRAFEPYVTTKSKGTGLGLAVVKKIADDHGARITLSNVESNGAIIGAQVSLSFAVAQSQQNVV
jgi:nitrogen fixation/metabolism regulation signal transduction histidine kinase